MGRREEMAEKACELGVEIDPESYNDKHKDPAHHKTLETLDAQQGALREAGFSDVECFFKDGLFTIYGGQKRA